MTTIRRALVLIGLTTAVMVGAAIPASATFADSVTAPTMTVGTATVQAPATVTLTGSCWTRTNSTWNATTQTYDTSYTPMYRASVSWTPSTSPKVTGYQVWVHFGAQSLMLAEVPASVTSVPPYDVERAALSMNPTVSIRTLTAYKWTADTARHTVPAC